MGGEDSVWYPLGEKWRTLEAIEIPYLRYGRKEVSGTFCLEDGGDNGRARLEVEKGCIWVNNSDCHRCC